MQDISIQAPSGILSGVLHQTPFPDSDTVLVICHGFRGSKDSGGRAVFLADAVATSGISVVRFDFTPHETLSTQIAELSSVVEFCRECICSNIILLGRSMGGSAALAFAAADQNIAGLCLWATPWNLKETFQLSLGEYYYRLNRGETILIDDEYGSARLTPNLITDFEKYDLLQCVRQVGTTPMLIIHGDKDQVVPLRQAKDIFQLAAGPKKLAVIEGGDHQFIHTYDQAQRELLHWLRQTFAGGKV